MKFSEYPIDKTIKKAIEELGYKKPTDIQFKAIKPILEGEDVMAIAQTGTGKTAAFVIPVLNRLLALKQKKATIRCLVMVPTRELAQQISRVFNEIGKYTSLKSLGLIGGVEQDSQIEKLTTGIDILVATPGRMFDLIHQGHIQLNDIKFLILDESDLMLNLGFNKDIQDVLKHIPKKRQTLFFSATIDKKIKSLAYDIVRNAIRIQISPKNPVSKNVSHSVTFIEMDDKRFFLENIIKEYENGKFIVFARTKVRVERIVAAMERVGIKSEMLHGSIDQKERFAILDRFREGKNKILVTTDVASRGIDLPNVEHVINYDLPENPENYVHRCGRCGRGNNKGYAISFCSDQEKSLLTDIEEYTGEEISRYELTKEEYKTIIKDTEDITYNWQKLLDDDNREMGTEDNW